MIRTKIVRWGVLGAIIICLVLIGSLLVKSWGFFFLLVAVVFFTCWLGNEFGENNGEGEPAEGLEPGTYSVLYAEKQRGFWQLLVRDSTRPDNPPFYVRLPVEIVHGEFPQMLFVREHSGIPSYTLSEKPEIE